MSVDYSATACDTLQATLIDYTFLFSGEVIENVSINQSSGFATETPTYDGISPMGSMSVKTGLSPSKARAMLTLSNFLPPRYVTPMAALPSPIGLGKSIVATMQVNHRSA